MLRHFEHFGRKMCENNSHETTMHSYFHVELVRGAWWNDKLSDASCSLTHLHIYLHALFLRWWVLRVSLNRFIYFSPFFHCKRKSITPFHFLFCILSVRSCLVFLFPFFADKMTNKATPTLFVFHVSILTCSMAVNENKWRKKTMTNEQVMLNAGKIALQLEKYGCAFAVGCWWWLVT